MKEVDRSVNSIDIVKKKSSSGCLIIKKKVPVPVPDCVGGVKGFSDSSSRNLFSSLKDKKRPRQIRSDSESSEDGFTEPNRRKVDNFQSGSGFGNVGFRENRGLETRERLNLNNLIDVHEFDERDGFRDKRVKVRNDGYDFTHRMNSNRQNGDDKASGSGGSSSRKIYDYRKDFVDDNRSGNFGAQSSRFTHGIKSHYKMEDNEPRLPILSSSGRNREVSDQPIRLQGKNGVLKVMVKKHKPISIPQQSYDRVEFADRKESIPVLYKEKHPNVPHKVNDHYEDTIKNKKVAMGSSLYSTLNRPEKPVSSKKRDLELTTNESETPLPLKVSSMQRSVPEKKVKSEQRVNVQTKTLTPVKGKETKVVKRGTGTEKQLLREKIRSMLLSAGWTIDYRPRRNRDYLDAVYINHSGTAYWSIIKAYEAFQKEEKDRSRVLPAETLSKLTRQTRKKIERDLKKRRDEEGAETSKRRLVEVSQDNEDDDVDDDDDDSNDSYYGVTDKVKNVGANADTVCARKSNKLGGRTSLIRSDGIKHENDQSGHDSGKLTLLSWLIDSGKVKMCEKVQYMTERKTMVMKEGWITKEGIRCCCCNKILTVSKFEVHAGSKLCQPFLNIFVESAGQSLMKCLIDAWNKQEGLERIGYHSVNVNGDDPNDDTCGLCGDGGDLICCDGCPSTFHQTCLGIQMLPKGDWHCPNCSCKYCEMANMSVGPESPLLVCALCEKKYHESCSMELDKPIDPNLSFCSHKCLQVYGHLKKLIGVKHELGSGLSWSLIRRSDISSDTCSSRELAQRVECNSKLAVARSVMDECFLPVIDRRSGINLIHNVVYNCGSNLSRMNYSGFLTAISEIGDELVSAASIRIHGTQLAEMPFIGTRHMYRRQGMCSRLLSTIQSVLSSIGIEKLVIPAIAENMDAWTGVGGFKPLEESHKHELKSMNILVLPGIAMLQKPLVSAKGSLRRHTPSIDVEKSEPNSVDDKESVQKLAPAMENFEPDSNDDKASVEKKAPAMEKFELNSFDGKESVEKDSSTTEISEPNSFEDRESLEKKASTIVEKSETNSVDDKESVEKNAPSEMEKSELNSSDDKEFVEKNAPPATEKSEPNSFDGKESVERNVPTIEKSEPISFDDKESVEKNVPAAGEFEPNSSDDKETVEKNAPTIEKSEPNSVDGKESVEKKEMALAMEKFEPNSFNDKDYVEKNVHAMEKSEPNSFDGKESNAPVMEKSEPISSDDKQSVEKKATALEKSETNSFDDNESVAKNASPTEKSELNSFDEKESVAKNAPMEEKSEPSSHDDNESADKTAPTTEKSEPDSFKDGESSEKKVPTDSYPQYPPNSLQVLARKDTAVHLDGDQCHTRRPLPELVSHMYMNLYGGFVGKGDDLLTMLFAVVKFGNAKEFCK
ncbi:uncharacterized protein [Rutidosis leptorrhynchoides]|uniref:uncharacterized protein n=1 Tax=Rutidosis leptorrhynchoides TaxID=125765 RepID=UPI003A994B45